MSTHGNAFPVLGPENRRACGEGLLRYPFPAFSEGGRGRRSHRLLLWLPTPALAASKPLHRAPCPWLSPGLSTDLRWAWMLVSGRALRGQERSRQNGPGSAPRSPGCGHGPGEWASPSRARSLVPLRICPNLPSLLSPSLFVLKPIPAPLGWGGGRVPPPPTPPGEGGAGPAGARRPPPPPPLRPAPAGSPAPRAESEADARSLIYGRPAVPGEGAPLSLGSGTWVRKRASARAAVGLDQELALSHRCPHARPPLGAPASSSGPSLPAS